MRKQFIFGKHVTMKAIVYSSFIMMLLFSVSCSKDPSDPPYIPEDGVPIRLSLNIPGGFIVPQRTKSQVLNECLISQIQVLVFEDDVYKYRVQGTIDQSGITSTTFTALLRTSVKPVTLYVIANANDAITNNEPVVGGTYHDIIPVITRSFTNSGISQYLPMFGVYTLSSGIDATGNNNVGQIKMLRSVARVDVANATANFEIKTVRAFRASDSIQIIPDAIADPDNPVVTAPSVPSGSTTSINTPVFREVAHPFTAQLYLPESIAPEQSRQLSSATCIVVGGFYNGNGTDTVYYRADFDSGEPGHPFGQILRNHLYTFNITGVNGPGWPTAEEAAVNAPSNIIAEVTSWDENSTDMIFDGTHSFGVSTRSVILEPWQGSSVEVLVSTDLNPVSYSIQWIDQYGSTIGDPSFSNIADENFSVTISEDKSKLLIHSITANTSEAVRSQKFLINVSRWNIIIEIRQGTAKSYEDVVIRIFSMNSDYGSLGSDNPDNPDDGGTARAFRYILKDGNNFGPNGKVRLKEIRLEYTNRNSAYGDYYTNTVFRNSLDKIDIVNITYGSNPDASFAAAIYDWLKSDTCRFLFITRDNSASSTTTNTQLINLLPCSSSYWQNGSGVPYLSYPKSNEQNSYFFTTGPFGSVDSTGWRIWDTTWQGIVETDETKEMLIPLVTTVLGANILYVISVVPANRIVYIGDSNLYDNNTYGMPATPSTETDNRAKLIANLYAWIFEKYIIPGKIKR